MNAAELHTLKCFIQTLKEEKLKKEKQNEELQNTLEATRDVNPKP